MKGIYLIGFMGSGKSTVGKALSRKLGVSYADTDKFIEEEKDMEIKDMFAEYGEAYFRELETNALELLDESIISTGGGIIKKSENMKLMKERGIIVYLEISFAEVCRRLAEDSTRPLWNKNDLEDKRKLYEERLNSYEANSNYIIACDSKDVNQIVEEIEALVK